MASEFVDWYKENHPDAEFSDDRDDEIRREYADIQEWQAEEAVRDIMDHKDYGQDNLVRLGNLPSAIQRVTGLSGDLYLFRNHIYENIVSEKRAKAENRYTSGAHYHALGEKTIIDSILSINEPDMIIADNPINGNPEMSMILPVFDGDGNPIHAAFSFYRDTDINGDRSKRPHIAVTFYGHSYDPITINGKHHLGLLEYLRNAESKGKILEISQKNRADQPVISERLPLTYITESTLKKNVARFKKEVNTFKEKNRINYSDEADDAIRKESARKRTERQLRQENERLTKSRR